MANRNLFGVLSMAVALTFSHAALGAESAPQGSKDLRLATSAMQGDRQVMQSLIKQHVDVNIAQGDGMTALHWAAYRNDLEMAKMLISAGASPKAVTRIEGLTPLAIACTNGNAAMIDTLLAAGASVNVADGIWTHRADARFRFEPAVRKP